MKHFEQLWNEAESVFSNHIQKNKNINLSAILQETQSHLLQLKENNSNNSTLYGKVLFNLCCLSNLLNLNVYEILENTIYNEKLNSLEDSDSD